jgi:hypothetical protein
MSLSNSPPTDNLPSGTKREFSRKWRIFVIFVVALSGIAGICTYLLFKQHVRKLYQFAIYANATSHYYDNHGFIPDSLEAIEAEYNDYDRKYAEIPASPWFLHPSFRPLKGLKGGPYLLYVENPVPGFPDPTRFLIYVKDTNPPTFSVENVWEWELADRTKADNELRARNQTTSTAPD